MTSPAVAPMLGEERDDFVHLLVDMKEEDMELRKGQARELRGAIQHMINRIQGGDERKKRYLIDFGGSLEERTEQMAQLSRDVAEISKRLKKPLYVHLMDAQDRRILHTGLRQEKDVLTESHGDPMFRRLCICKHSLPRLRCIQVIPEEDRAPLYCDPWLYCFQNPAA